MFFKYEDAEGLGWCDLLEESDVSVQDEACVEFEPDDANEIEYE